MKVAKVTPFLPFNTEFDYYVPADIENIDIGDVVEIEFGHIQIIGYVSSFVADIDNYEFKTLKYVKSVIINNIFNSNIIKLIHFAAQYNLCYIGNFAKLVFPFSDFDIISTTQDLSNMELYYTISPNADLDSVKSKTWKEVYTIFQSVIDSKISERQLLEITTKPTVKKFENLGLIISEYCKKEIYIEKNYTIELPKLSEEQSVVLENILNYTSYNCPILLDGETGSGKTEVYFHVMQNILLSKTNKPQILILLPEISLANTIAARFLERFQFKACIWHSSISNKVRRQQYLNIMNGSEQVIIGTRSALFLPYHNLQLIIVDEEHDSSYKQDDIILYHARNMAVVRSNFESIPIILSSATPSIETMVNAQDGKYKHVILKNRFLTATFPDIKIIDLKKDKLNKGSSLSLSVMSQITETINNGWQVLLFLNRRGYAPIVICKLCGEKVKCLYCDICLVEHRFSEKLQCHQCGYKINKPSKCKKCDGDDYGVMGVGVERLYEEVVKSFPEYETTILSSDTMTTNTISEKAISDVIDGKFNIIIGTQIVSKGYHFPLLKFVCIVEADVGMHSEDFRCFERTFQMLFQVAGRSGREGDDKGLVMIQTYEEKNQVLQAIAKYDKDGFYKTEIANRKKYLLPPFEKQISIIISNIDKNDALTHSQLLGQKLDSSFKDNKNDIQILGPAPSSIAYLRGRHRFRILICYQRMGKIKLMILNVIHNLKIPKSTTIKLDVDPINFY